MPIAYFTLRSYSFDCDFDADTNADSDPDLHFSFTPPTAMLPPTTARFILFPTIISDRHGMNTVIDLHQAASNFNGIYPKNISTEKYQKGLTILRSAQCPYSVKNVDAIMVTARKMKIPVNLVELKEVSAVQQAPCAFGTFCIIKDGNVLSHHQISNTRFENIMKSVK